MRGGRPRAISEEKMIAIKKALNDGMSKASICRTFEVKRSTLIDSLNRYDM
ncbi:helix-turn-helix domain-containing protein [Aliarcobacter cryaerophilus]|uniref:helix-turn-helix domain-containing protein n=1 Tax=Aliarcobacter cryaerophilus TaxID=28198 RepID=UPI0028CB16CD|nr:helix-turn-helix domain-containing protein [Aliarcobacter cryaerophilus]